MLTKTETLYARNCAALERWKTAKNAIAAYTTVPVGMSLWDIFQSPSFKEIFIYLLLVVGIVVTQVIFSGKVGHYQAMVMLLKGKLKNELPDKLDT